MPDPSTSVLPDFSTGYRPPRFFDYTLKLDPQLDKSDYDGVLNAIARTGD